MIRFTLGEDRYVKFLVRSTKGEHFTIEDASFVLLHNGEEESSGSCKVMKMESGNYVSAKISPCHRSRYYALEITLHIADEVIKNREQMEVM